MWVTALSGQDLGWGPQTRCIPTLQEFSNIPALPGFNQGTHPCMVSWDPKARGPLKIQVHEGETALPP